MSKLEELKKRCEGLIIPKLPLIWLNKEERERIEETMNLIHKFVNINLKNRFIKESED